MLPGFGRGGALEPTNGRLWLATWWLTQKVERAHGPFSLDMSCSALSELPLSSPRVWRINERHSRGLVVVGDVPSSA
jgi:hypothetical protein